MADRVEQQFGNYRLIRLLGRGGFAEVYLGEHIHIQTQAAIKILSTQLVTKDLERFIREARTIASFEHEHIVRVFDFGIQEEIPFLVMSYAPNGTLRQRHPHESHVSLDNVLSYVQQIAPALHYAHGRKVIHRDVKPENMLVGSRGEILLSDFGIAVTTATSTSRETKTTAGTVAYMAPEQIMGKPCTASDQYALGVIVYEWLSGEQPFHGSFFEMCAQHLHAPLPSLREINSEIPPEIEQCVAKALSKNPEERFACIQDFATALQERSLQTISSLFSSLAQQPSPEKPSDASQNDPTVIKTPQETSVLPQLGSNDPTVIKTPPNVSSLSHANTTNPNHLKPTLTPTTPLHISQDQSTLLKEGAEPTVHTAREPSFAFTTQPSALPNQVQRPDKLGYQTKRSLIMIVACFVLLVLLVATPFLLPSLPRVRSAPHPTNTPTQQRVQQPSLTGQPTLQPSLTEQPTSQPSPTGQPTLQPSPTGQLTLQPSPTGQPTPQPVQRTLSSTQAQSSTVNATGQGTTPGTQAKGTLTLTNGDTSGTFTMNAGDVVSNPTLSPPLNNLQMMIDATVTLPPAAVMDVPAHVVQVGTFGNISAQAWTCCLQSPISMINNAPFTGGTDTQSYTFVQQSDIDGAAEPLKTSTRQAAVTNMQQQLQANEHRVGNPQCTSDVTSNHAANDRASTVTVTVSTTCTITAST